MEKKENLSFFERFWSCPQLFSNSFHTLTYRAVERKTSKLLLRNIEATAKSQVEMRNYPLEKRAVSFQNGTEFTEIK